MKLCFSPTTLQGDIWALAWYFQQRVKAGADIDLVIGVDDVADYQRTPIARLLPFEAPLWERSEWSFERRVKRFDPDFLFVDNHLPSQRCFRNLVYLWHGFGWKEQRAEIEFEGVHKDLKKVVGSVRQPNPHFIHQCYGAFEKTHRVEFTDFHPDNCRVMGMLYADALLHPPVTRAAAQATYPFRDWSRPTVLLGLTWGFGEVFEHWDGDERGIVDRLLTFLAEREANVIFRLHDRKRYDAQYLAMMEAAAQRYGNVLLKYKDVERDNLLDVLVSDVIVSNFSGLVVYAYFTGAGAIHLHPLGMQRGEQPLYRFRRGKRVYDKRASYLWKMPPEENGGWLARNEAELYEQLDRCLADPTCCRERSAAFVARYMETTQGQCCSALDGYLTRWAEHGAKPPADG